MMFTNLRQQRLLGQSAAVLLGLFMLLTACGSDATQATAAVADAPTPTPIPTTAPLSLPPADANLPELAALPAVETPRVTPPVPPATDAPGDNAAEPATPTDTTGTIDDQSTTSATGTTGATGVIDDQPTTSAAIASLATISSAGQWTDCVISAAQRIDATALLDPIAAGTATDMTSVQLNALAAASTDCDIVNTSLDGTDLVDYLPTAQTCLDAWLQSSGGGSVFVGLASIGWSQPTPSWAQGHLIDALDSCLGGVSFAADVMSVVSVDPSLSGAFDASCLAASFDASGTLRSYAQMLATQPANAALYVSLSDQWVLNCANVGQMVAAAAAADGVALSSSTIACIDSELTSAGVLSALVAGTADTDAVGIATISCLTDVEAAALLG